MSKISKKKQTVQNNIYTQANEMLNNNGKCLIDAATGSGKTYISLVKISISYDKIIYVYPTYDLFDSVSSKYNMDNMFCITYHTFCKSCMIDMVNDYIQDTDHSKVLFIFDEAHHLGGLKASKNIKKLMEEWLPDIKYLGISATPLRVDGIHVGVEFFDDNIVHYSMQQAFEDGILDKPLYYTAEFDAKKNLEAIKESYFGSGYITKEQEKKLKDMIDRINRNRSLYINFEDMLYRRLPDFDIETGKTYQCYLFFYSNTDNMMHSVDIHTDIFKRMFPDKKIRMHIISSKKDIQLNPKINNLDHPDNTIDLIFSVNKLIEGIHLEIVHGVFMFRRTISDRVYVQMLGRIYSIDKEKVQGVVFDMVENSRINYKHASEVREMVKRKRKYYEEFIMDKVITVDTEDNVDNILRLCQKWKDETILYLVSKSYLRNPERGTKKWLKELKKFDIDMTEDQFFDYIENSTNEDIQELRKLNEG